MNIENDRTNKTRIRNLLCHPKLPWLLICLAFLLVSPALTTGLQLDDWLHKMILQDRMIVPPVEDASFSGLFSFIPEDSERIKQYIDFGIVPWWTLENLHLTFWRPISEITHWIDYRLWPNFPSIMHLQSILWFCGLILVVSKLYRKIFGPVFVAGLAALLYAVDDAHAFPTAWIANRNALVAALFGATSLLTHVKWRQDGWKPGIIMGPFFLLIGLLSGEAAVGICGYFFAYALFVDDCSYSKKIMSILPYIIVTLAWWFIYKNLGFGTWGSGTYIDPGQEPLFYISALVKRAPILLLGQWAMPPALIYNLLPENIAFIYWLSAAGFILILFVLLFPIIRKNAIARFWTLGMIIALIPICTTFPDNRLNIFVGIGAMGLLAQFFAFWFDKAAWLPTTKTWLITAKIFVMLFIAVHLVLATVLLPITTKIDDVFDKVINNSIENKLLDADFSEQQIILMNPPGSFHVMNSRIMRYMKNKNISKYTRMLGTGTNSLHVTRIDSQTLEVLSEKGHIPSYLDVLFRGKAHPMMVGQKVKLTGLSIEVLSLTDDQQPKNVQFCFSVPLESSSLKFLQWKDGNYIKVSPPAIGKTIYLPGTPALY